MFGHGWILDRRWRLGRSATEHGKRDVTGPSNDGGLGIDRLDSGGRRAWSIWRRLDGLACLPYELPGAPNGVSRQPELRDRQRRVRYDRPKRWAVLGAVPGQVADRVREA